MQPLRITYNQACHLLGITRNTLRELPKKDPSFPKCYKFGSTRQAPVYYDYADLLAWHNAQKEKATSMGVQA